MKIARPTYIRDITPTLLALRLSNLMSVHHVDPGLSPTFRSGVQCDSASSQKVIRAASWPHPKYERNRSCYSSTSGYDDELGHGLLPIIQLGGPTVGHT